MTVLKPEQGCEGRDTESENPLAFSVLTCTTGKMVGGRAKENRCLGALVRKEFSLELGLRQWIHKKAERLISTAFPTLMSLPVR